MKRITILKGVFVIIMCFIFVTVGNVSFAKAETTDKSEEKVEVATKTELLHFDTAGEKLKYGKYGETVYQLKSFLSDMGFKITDVNYSFDSQTRDCVKEFQKSYKLKPDGIVGKNTYKAINESIDEFEIVLPTFSYNFSKKIPTGKWIVINKTDNMLYLFNKDKLVHKYPVATGKKASYTPEGKFTIVIKLVNPAWGGGGYAEPIAGGKSNNPLGKRWMGLSKGGGGRYGIHGNADEDSIGTFASHGCIRMHNADVVKLYELVGKETPVWIGTEKTLKTYGVTFVAK